MRIIYACLLITWSAGCGTAVHEPAERADAPDTGEAITLSLSEANRLVPFGVGCAYVGVYS